MNIRIYKTKILFAELLHLYNTLQSTLTHALSLEPRKTIKG